MTGDRGPDSDSAGEDVTAPEPRPTREYVGLLTQIMTNTLDEGYETVARRRTAERPAMQREHGRLPGNRAASLVVLAAFGVLVGVSALQTDLNRSGNEAERVELIAQIHKQEGQQTDLKSRIAALEDDVTQLQGDIAGEVTRNSKIDARMQVLGVEAGSEQVHGPGILVTVDNAPDSAGGPGGTILDTDLQALVNALWTAGAEAISIDGHRLTTLTAIRFAGQAITVDYSSLTPPYVISAIGDPDTLPARLLETGGGQSWLGLKANFGIRFDTARREEIIVPADPHEHLLFAKPTGGR